MSVFKYQKTMYCAVRSKGRKDSLSAVTLENSLKEGRNRPPYLWKCSVNSSRKKHVTLEKIDCELEMLQRTFSKDTVDSCLFSSSSVNFSTGRKPVLTSFTLRYWQFYSKIVVYGTLPCE
jgi:hypothetical protein